MNTTVILLIIGIILLLIASIVGYIFYQKKKQFGFVFKLLKKQKELEKQQKIEQEFVEKQESKSKNEAQAIVEALGGVANIEKVEQCAIRLRVFVISRQKVNEKALKQAGVSGVLKTSRNIQLIVGDRSVQIAAEIASILEGN
ncbi:MAG: glucose PTS transporter subunit EIIB [Culicoidibacterales bacterium]